jgi:hypothetical protein
MILQSLKATASFLWTQIWGIVIGVISSLVASLITTVVDKSNSIRKVERMIIQSVGHRRFRKILRNDDPHALIRTEWAVALRDLGSKKTKDVLRALESLSHMADILEFDERNVAGEAVRLKFAFNNNHDIDQKYLTVMQELLD